MRQHNETIHGFAVCVDNTGYPAALELHKVYQVLPDDEAAQDGDLRVIDESGEDYLYTAKRFLAIRLPTETDRALRESFSLRLAKPPVDG